MPGAHGESLDMVCRILVFMWSFGPLQLQIKPATFHGIPGDSNVVPVLGGVLGSLPRKPPIPSVDSGKECTAAT